MTIPQEHIIERAHQMAAGCNLRADCMEEDGDNLPKGDPLRMALFRAARELKVMAADIRHTLRQREEQAK